jgi:hypothetical protein
MIYSFGMVLLESVTRVVPWAEESWDSEVATKVLRGERPTIPSTCPRKLRKLIKKCWHQDPRKRPTFQRIVDKLRSFQDIFQALDDSATAIPIAAVEVPSTEPSAIDGSPCSQGMQAIDLPSDEIVVEYYGDEGNESE